MKKLSFIILALILPIFITSVQAQKLSFLCDDGTTLVIPRISPIPPDSSRIILLNGTWKFSDNIKDKPCTSPIAVPGEWVMQGFNVEKENWAGYERSFTIPRQWEGKRIKLRFDAVFSEAEIWVNEQHAGHHLGGFTPFELDISKYVKRGGGKNILLVKVKSSTIVDSLASASQYAVHPLGGISRKVFLMAVPKINLSYFNLATKFDKKYENAQLLTDVIISNEGDHTGKRMSLSLNLFKDEDLKNNVVSKTVNLDNLSASEKMRQKRVVLQVDRPLKWDPEHPVLYWLELTLHVQGQADEVIIRPVGFRQIEVRGNRVFVNNQPIKLRGINRHEVMPLRGRSVLPGVWERDVKLFRDANINYIRTSHYPPAPEFILACDKLGMFVEVEAPFCWAERTDVPDSMYGITLVDQTLQMVNEFKSHPSVLIWSIGNESGKYAEYFSKTAALVKLFDPTRPRNFSQYSPNGDNGELEIGNQHYPGLKGLTENKAAKRPIIFDEYCHINAYNRLELNTDPALRYLWGKGFHRMWEAMYHTPSILGGAIWAGIDDTFILPDSSVVGYGTWGIIDGWRREKPEYWEVKKVYSPVKVTQLGNFDPKNNELRLKFENRFLFTNLSECNMEWRFGKQNGHIKADVKPGDSVVITLHLTSMPKPGESLDLKIFDDRNVMVDIYNFLLLPSFTENDKREPLTAMDYQDIPGGLVIKAGKTIMKIDKNSASILNISYDGKKIINGSAELLISVLNGEGFGTQMTGGRNTWPVVTAGCKNRVVQQVSLQKHKTFFELGIYDIYKEAQGVTTYRLEDNGVLRVSYQYTLKEDINPQQWGLIFSLPGSFDELQWSRRGQWNTYPERDIARLSGIAKARSGAPYSGPAGPESNPDWLWKLDQNILGTNDFRSTKANVIHAGLTDGVNKFSVIGHGNVDVRSWIDNENDDIKLLLASYTGLGAERFFRAHAQAFDQPLKAGDIIKDSFNIQLGK